MIAFLVIVLVAPVAGQQRPTSAPATASSLPTSNPAGPRIVDFGDGIKINYVEHQVEVQGQVILRDGPLELFAYCKAPAPKEHESIVLVKAKPQRIFMALGLIGATPGVTLRWYAETQKLREPTGDPIDVQVRYLDGKRERQVPATDWMLDASKRKPMAPTNWIFCGSERSDSGEFAADMEGTLVTVVDFTTSVLALPQRHSDSDSELWLVANSDAIPAVGTSVTLVLRPMSTEIVLHIDASGAIRIDGQPVARKEIGERLKQQTAGWMDRASILIESPGTKPGNSAANLALRRELTEIGFAPIRIRARDASSGLSPGKSAAPKAPTPRVGG